MTEQPTPPHGADEEPPGAEDARPSAGGARGASEKPRGAGENARMLRRSRDERMLAGVLGGLAQRLGVDPLLLRIVTVVLAVFGGVGIVIYAAGWLLIPAEDADRSVAEQALGRGDDRPEPATLWLAGGLVLAILFAAGATFGSGVGTVLLVLAATGVLVLLRRDGDAAASSFADRAPEDDPGAASPHVGRVPPGDEAHDERARTEDEPTDIEPEGATEGADEPHAVADDGGHRPEYAHSLAAPVQPASAWPDPPDWPAADFDPAMVEASKTPVGDGKKASSHLGGLTLSAVAVALGILAINDVAYAVVPASAYVALALAVIGAGLLIGTWFGRSRGLIAWGLIAMFLALPVATIGDYLNWDVSGEQRTITIDDVAQLPEGPQSHGNGQIIYDLGSLELADDDTVALDVAQNAGQLQIIVPPEADVTVDAATGMGHVVAFDEQASGNQDITVTDAGSDGAGGGELTLELELELGEIIVERTDTPGGQEVPR